nr:UDP-glycosyltransferase 85C1-like [Tanacetum cinerariifolium]
MRRAEQRVVPESIGSTVYGRPYLGWASTLRSVSEEVSAAFHSKRTFNKCHILSLADKALLTGGYYNNPLFQNSFYRNLERGKGNPAEESPLPLIGEVKGFFLRLLRRVYIMGLCIVFNRCGMLHSDYLQKRTRDSTMYEFRGGPAGVMKGIFHLTTLKPAFSDQVPDGLPSTSDADNIPPTQTWRQLSNYHATNFFHSFLNLVSEFETPERCIISNGLMNFTKTYDVAKKLNVPIILHWTLSASGFIGYYQAKVLVEKGLVPLKGIRLKDLPRHILATKPDDHGLNICLEAAQSTDKVSHNIIHTFDELEGTLVKSSNQSSVVYVNFGSLAVMSLEDLIEFGWGLVNSDHYFLWMITDLVDGGSLALPTELEEGIKRRGFIANWCSQEEVLSHPSIVGFLTHGGWGSMIEILSTGVPIVTGRAAPTPDQCGAISSPLLVARTTPLPLEYSNKTNRNKPATLAFTDYTPSWISPLLLLAFIKCDIVNSTQHHIDSSISREITPVTFAQPTILRTFGENNLNDSASVRLGPTCLRYHLSRGHRFDPAWRPYTDKDQPSISRIIEVHWFRPALDSSGERPQLPTSVVPFRVLYSWHVLHPYRWGTPTRPIGINHQPSHSRTPSKQNPTLQNLDRNTMLCWPVSQDQRIICIQTCKEWEVGMEIGKKVNRHEVKKLVRELMNGIKGKRLRRKAIEWKTKAEIATAPNGSSTLNIEELLHEITVLSRN